ncbi:unnamed protein product [Pedinophyceae sp. YPF-701]|nr:unnamed protein product [Pedinophyceae sp. YPF-701]
MDGGLGFFSKIAMQYGDFPVGRRATGLQKVVGSPAYAALICLATLVGLHVDIIALGASLGRSSSESAAIVAATFAPVGAAWVADLAVSVYAYRTSRVHAESLGLVMVGVDVAATLAAVLAMILCTVGVADRDSGILVFPSDGTWDVGGLCAVVGRLFHLGSFVSHLLLAIAHIKFVVVLARYRVWHLVHCAMEGAISAGEHWSNLQAIRATKVTCVVLLSIAVVVISGTSQLSAAQDRERYNGMVRALVGTVLPTVRDQATLDRLYANLQRGRTPLDVLQITSGAFTVGPPPGSEEASLVAHALVVRDDGEATEARFWTDDWARDRMVTLCWWHIILAVQIPLYMAFLFFTSVRAVLKPLRSLLHEVFVIAGEIEKVGLVVHGRGGAAPPVARTVSKAGGRRRALDSLPAQIAGVAHTMRVMLLAATRGRNVMQRLFHEAEVEGREGATQWLDLYGVLNRDVNESHAHGSKGGAAGARLIAHLAKGLRQRTPAGLMAQGSSEGRRATTHSATPALVARTPSKSGNGAASGRSFKRVHRSVGAVVGKSIDEDASVEAAPPERVDRLVLLGTPEWDVMELEEDEILTHVLEMFAVLGLTTRREQSRRSMALSRSTTADKGSTGTGASSVGRPSNTSRGAGAVHRALRLDTDLDGDEGLVDEEVLRMFLCRLRARYADRPYHNWRHAVDVCHTAFCMLISSPELTNALTRLDAVAVLVAACGHDVGHLGVSNGFLVATRHPLALKYNDESVQENMHAAVLFQIMAESSATDVLAALKPAEFARVRKLIIRLIICTDMSKHFDLQAAIELVADRFPDDEPVGTVVRSDLSSMLCAVLHLADLGHTFKPVSLSPQWAARVVDEFYHQGDCERELGMNVNPMMDRNSGRVPVQQMEFYEVFIRPYLTQLLRVAPSMAPILTRTVLMYLYWASEAIPLMSADDGSALLSNGASHEKERDGGKEKEEKEKEKEKEERKEKEMDTRSSAASRWLDGKDGKETRTSLIWRGGANRAGSTAALHTSSQRRQHALRVRDFVLSALPLCDDEKAVVAAATQFLSACVPEGGVSLIGKDAYDAAYAARLGLGTGERMVAPSPSTSRKNLARSKPTSAMEAERANRE